MPIVGDVAVGAAVPARRPRSSASRPSGRAVPARVARAPARVHPARNRDRERSARVHRGRPGARSRSPPRTGVDADAICGDRRPISTSPTGANLEVPGRDRAHGRLGLRDREDDGLARARPRGRGARDRRHGSCRPARRASRSPAGASPSTPSSPTSSPAPPSGSSSRAAERGGDLLLVEGQGSISHPGLLGRDARPHPRLGAARVRALPQAGTTEIDGLSRPSAALARRARGPARAGLAPAPTRRGRVHRAQHAAPRRRRRLERRSPPPRPRPASSPTTRCGSAPAACSTRLLAHLGAPRTSPGVAPRSGADGGESGELVRRTAGRRPCAVAGLRGRGRGARCRCRRERRHGEVRRPTRGAVFFSADGRHSGCKQSVMTTRFDAERPADDPGSGGARPRRSRRPSAQAFVSFSPSTRTRRGRSRAASLRPAAFAAWLTPWSPRATRPSSSTSS